MKFSDILKANPIWIESITQEAHSSDKGIMTTFNVTCIGRLTPIPELEELVSDCDGITHSKIRVAVIWANYS